MDIGLAKKIVRQIGELDGNKWVALHGAGEPLLHRGLIELLRYTSNFKNLQFGFLTNGMLLDETISRSVLDSGMSWIGFSIDGTDRERFEKYRVGSRFEQIMRNVIRFLELKYEQDHKINTKVNMTVQDDMKDDIDTYIDFWIDKVDEVLISPCRPIGLRNNVLFDRGVKRVPCYMLYEMMVIYWDGKTGLCCEDWFNDGNMGDVSSSDLKEIWQGDKFLQARRLHEHGQFLRLPLCGDCNSWHISVGSEHFSERHRCRVQKNAWQHTYRK